MTIYPKVYPIMYSRDSATKKRGERDLKKWTL